MAQQEIERLKQQGQQADAAGSPAAPAAAAAAGDVASKVKGKDSSQGAMQQKLLAASKKQARVSSARQSLAEGDFLIKAKH